MLLLALVVVPPGLAAWLLYKFWQLSRASAAQPAQGRWGALVLLAALAGLIAEQWWLFALELMSSGKNSHKLYADTFYQTLSIELLLGAVFAAGLMARFMRWRVAGSFLGGLLLALAAAVGIWQYQHQPPSQAPTILAAPLSDTEPRPTGWQAATADSLQRRQQAGTVFKASQVGQVPAFPGGPALLQQTIWAQMHFPPTAANRVVGEVALEFVVEADGRVTLPHVTAGLGAAYDVEAVRIVRHLPRFRPGHRRGRPVAVVWACTVPFW